VIAQVDGGVERGEGKIGGSIYNFEEELRQRSFGRET